MSKGERIWEEHLANCQVYFNESKSFPLELSEHPIEIQDRIRNLKPDKQGYNFWGKWETAKYYEN